MPEPPETGSRGCRGLCGPPPVLTALTDFVRDLTQAAADGKLDPLIGREQELDVVIEVLCRRYKESDSHWRTWGGQMRPGRRSGTADRRWGGRRRNCANKWLMALDGRIVAGWALHRRNAEERFNQAIKALTDATEAILFIDDLHLFIEAASRSGAAVVTSILKHWLLRGKLVCVGACTPGDYAELTRTAPWIRDGFVEVHIHPLDEKTTRQVLGSRKHHYESFHGVSYADDALDVAVSSSAAYLPHKPMPGKALELLDAAAARVTQRQAAQPLEIGQSMKALKLILKRMDSAIQNHEFEKARFYSEEERKERDNLRALHEKYHVDDVPAPVVTRKDVEEVISQWAAYPFQP